MDKKLALQTIASNLHLAAECLSQNNEDMEAECTKEVLAHIREMALKVNYVISDLEDLEDDMEQNQNQLTVEEALSLIKEEGITDQRYVDSIMNMFSIRGTDQYEHLTEENVREEIAEAKEGIEFEKELNARPLWQKIVFDKDGDVLSAKIVFLTMCLLLIIIGLFI